MKEPEVSGPNGTLHFSDRDPRPAANGTDPKLDLKSLHMNVPKTQRGI